MPEKYVPRVFSVVIPIVDIDYSPLPSSSKKLIDIQVNPRARLLIRTSSGSTIARIAKMSAEDQTHIVTISLAGDRPNGFRSIIVPQVTVCEPMFLDSKESRLLEFYGSDKITLRTDTKTVSAVIRDVRIAQPRGYAIYRLVGKVTPTSTSLRKPTTTVQDQRVSNQVS